MASGKIAIFRRPESNNERNESRPRRTRPEHILAHSDAIAHLLVVRIITVVAVASVICERVHNGVLKLRSIVC